MRDWYKTVLNARIVFDDGSLCFLTYDDEHHRLAIRRIDGLADRDPRACGILHIAYSFKTIRQLLSTYLRLKEQGILPNWTINHGPTLSMYFADPDGMLIELQVDNFATKEAAAAYLATSDFRDNPIGVVFDPDDMVRRFDAGEAEESLKRRAPLPPGMTPNDMRPKPTRS
jgi:hypothetical protein